MLYSNVLFRALYDSALDLFSRSQSLPPDPPSSPEFEPKSPPASPADSSVPNSPRVSLRGQPDDWDDSLSSSSYSPTVSSPPPPIWVYPPAVMRQPNDYKLELGRYRSEVQRLDERCRVLEKTVKETKDLLKARENEIERLRREHEEERRKWRRLELESPQRYGRSERRSPSSAPRSHSADEYSPDGFWNEMEFQSEMVYAEERAQERSFDAFLTKTDAWSGAQVIQAVNDLNSEILQFAAAATELCTFDRRGRASPSRPTQAMQDTSERIGPHMTRILVSKDHSADPILVQLAVQGCVSSIIARAFSSFCIGLQGNSDAVLTQIFSRIWVSEPQPTSSKWRSLAHRHIHTIQPNLAEYAVNDMAETILRACLDVLAISGCMKFDMVPFSRESIRGRFGDQVIRICDRVATLERVSKEDIMSTNFEVVAVDRTEEYQPGAMSDAFGDYVSSRGRILCTMDLGLRCTTRKGGTEVMHLTPDSFEQRLLLKPKVVLESVLEVLHDGR